MWLDARHLGEAFWEKRFPTILATTRSHGVDPVTELIPVAPACHYASGGIRTDLWGRSDLPGLYATGEAACSGVHGANRLASNSLLEGLVFSRRIATVLPAELRPWSEPAADARTARPGRRRDAPRAAGGHELPGGRAAHRRRARGGGRAARQAVRGRRRGGRPRVVGDDQPAHRRRRPRRRRAAAPGDPRLALARGLPGPRRRALGRALRRDPARRCDELRVRARRPPPTSWRSHDDRTRALRRAAGHPDRRARRRRARPRAGARDGRRRLRRGPAGRRHRRHERGRAQPRRRGRWLRGA